MNIWGLQRVLLDDYLSGNNGARPFFPALKGRHPNGTTTAAAFFAASHELCYVSESPDQRAKFLDYLCDMVSRFGHTMSPIKDGYKIKNADGVEHDVVAVAGADARPMTTFVNDGEPVECDAPLVVRKYFWYQK